MLVRHVGEGAALGLALRTELALRYQEGRHDARRHQVEAHDQGCSQEHLARIPYASLRMLRLVAGVSAHQRHHANAGLEAGEAEGQPRKYEERHPDHAKRTSILPEDGPLPIGQNLGLGGDLVEACPHDHEVDQQIGPDHGDREADRFSESLEEDPTEHREQCQCDEHPLIPQGLGPERVLDHVGRCVRRRKGDCDDPGGRHETEQAQDEQLAFPERKQAFEHGDRTLPVRALRSDDVVHGQHPEERQQYDQQRGDGRQRACGSDRNPRYVAQGGEVVDAGQAHDLPPRMLLFSLPGLGPLHLFDALFQEPAHDSSASLLLRDGGFGHYATLPVGEVRLAWVGRYPFMVNAGSIGYRRSSGQNLLPPPGLLVLQPRPLSASATSSTSSDGFVAALMPAFLSASLLASAVLSPPETMAPACPMVLPSGAVKPAIYATTGMLISLLTYSAASCSALPPTSPIITAHYVAGSASNLLRISMKSVPMMGSPPIPTAVLCPISRCVSSLTIW